MTSKESPPLHVRFANRIIIVANEDKDEEKEEEKEEEEEEAEGEGVVSFEVDN